MGCSSSQIDPAWVPSIGCSPSGTGCTTVGLPQGHKPCCKPARSWAPLSTGSQVLAGACSSMLSPWGHRLLGSHVIYLLQRGVHSMGYRWISSPPWTSMDCRGTAWVIMVFIMSCRRKLSTLAPGASPPPPSSLTLVSAELFLSHSLTPLSRTGSLQLFSPSYMCYHRSATTIADWLSLGQWWVLLRAGWHWVYQTCGKLLATCHRSHPCSPPTTKTLPLVFITE